MVFGLLNLLSPIAIIWFIVYRLTHPWRQPLPSALKRLFLGLVVTWVILLSFALSPN
jgi:hypothetical protein